MKKIIAFILAMIMAFSLTACGNQNKENPNTKPSGSTLEATEQQTQSGVYTGEVTEEVVRNYKTAAEGDFSYKEIEGGIYITKYIGNDVIVVIPESISGKPVVQIDNYVFANESNVRGVLVPDTVKQLEETFVNNAFIEVVICEGVEQLLTGVFTNCPNLHTVILGDTLAFIGSSVFGGCTMLKELYLPPTVRTIEGGWSVFSGCLDLTISGEVGSYIETFCAEKGILFKAA